MKDDFEKQLTFVRLFVDCYLIYYGTAGKCDKCCAKGLCHQLNDDCKQFARKEMSLASRGYETESKEV